MQFHKICIVFVGLGLIWSPSFALAQDFSNDLPFHSKAEIHDHVVALDALKDKLNRAIPTEDGNYLLDINENSVSGAMASLAFYRYFILQAREGIYHVERAVGSRKMPGDLDFVSNLEDVGKEMDARQIQVRFENAAEGFLKQDQSFISFYTEKGHLVIGDGSPSLPNEQFMGSSSERFRRGVSYQGSPSIRQIQFDTFYTTDFGDAEEIRRVLGKVNEPGGFGHYASAMQKLKIAMIQTFPEEYAVFVKRIESTLSRPIEHERLAKVFEDDLSRVLSGLDPAREDHLLFGLIKGLGRSRNGISSLALDDFRMFRILADAPFSNITRGLDNFLRRGGVGGVLIGLGVVGGGLLLSADTAHASEADQDPIPVYWTLTSAKMQEYLEDIQHEKVFWSDFLQQQQDSTTTSIFGL